MKNQPKLTCEKETVITVEARDLDKFVEQVYGQSFCFSIDQEANNNSHKCFSRIGGIFSELDEYDEEKLKEFIETGEHDHLARVLLNDLCRKGLIEAGKYIIAVCW